MENAVYLSCPGRVCFCGEYLDNIMKPVVACSLDGLRVYVKARKAPGLLSTITSYAPFNVKTAFNIHDPIRYMSGHLDYVRAVCNIFKEEHSIDNIELEIKSNLIHGAGLASSGALSVLVASVLNRLFELDLKMDEVCSLAHKAESESLATGVGQMDHVISGFGGLLLVDCSTNPPGKERLLLRNDVAIITGSTKLERNIRQVQNQMAQRMAKKESIIIKFIESTTEILTKITTLLSHPDWNAHELGTYLTQCHIYLRNYAQVSNEPIERFIKIALNTGALGAKLTGATGEGGSMFAISSLDAAPEIAKAITKAGGQAHISSMSENGLLSGRPEEFDLLPIGYQAS